jgi:hypothetical protein
MEKKGKLAEMTLLKSMRDENVISNEEFIAKDRELI